MEHHDDGKTMIIELKKDADSAQSKEDDVTLTHSSLFPVKPKKSSFFRRAISASTSRNFSTISLIIYGKLPKTRAYLIV